MVDTLPVAHNCGVARVVELLMTKCRVTCDLALDHAESVVFVLGAPAVNRTVAALGSALCLAAVKEQARIGEEVVGVLLKLAVVGAGVHEVT